MNVCYVTIWRFTSVLLALLLAVSLSAQALFQVEPLPSATIPALKKELAAYQLVRLDSRAWLEFFTKNTSGEIELSLPDQQRWTLSLAQNDIRSANYQLQIATAEGAKPSSGYGALTLAGQIQTQASEAGNCHLTLNEGFLYGVFEIGKTTWYIEPARRFGQSAGFDAYLLYRAEDVLADAEGRCAAVAAGDWRAEAPVKKTNADCISLDIALAADYSMFAMFEDIATLENYALGILNNVHANYDDEFEQTVRFRAVTLYAVTCQNCDPWDPGFEPRTEGPQTLRLKEIGERSVTFEAVSEGGMQELAYSSPEEDQFVIDILTAQGGALKIELETTE